MSIIMLLGWPYYWLFPRLVLLYALSKGFKAMSQINKGKDNDS